MFTELIGIFTLLATLPNRAVVLTEAAFVIVAFLFALELAAPLIVVVGLILKASALQRVRLNVGRALQRSPRARGAWPARARIGAAATPVRPAAGEASRVLAKSSDRGKAPSEPSSIEALAHAIDEAQSSRDPPDRP